MWSYNHNDELVHYGVPGMKWGVRRAKVHAAYDEYMSKKINANEEYKKAKSMSKNEHKKLASKHKYERAVQNAKFDLDTKLMALNGKPCRTFGQKAVDTMLTGVKLGGLVIGTAITIKAMDRGAAYLAGKLADMR